MFIIIIGWICVVLADFVAVVALNDCWRNRDPKSGLAPVMGLFIVIPFMISGLWILGVNVSWHTAWALVPAFVMTFEGLRRIFL